MPAMASVGISGKYQRGIDKYNIVFYWYHCVELVNIIEVYRRSNPNLGPHDYVNMNYNYL